jgi:hypothetical protein|tara:strand:- start:6354 stop:7991 length:1638 start_codon:yes stop_codon:yes gene_type:complete
MSAGSAFAAGLRSGQAIYDSAVRNAMARKRLDMARTEFKYQQERRKQLVEDEVSATNAFGKLVDYLGAGELDFKQPQDRETYLNILATVEPEISRDPATFKRYEAFKKTFEEKESLPIFRDQQRKIANIGLTWDINNPGMPRPVVKDDEGNVTGEDTNKMRFDNDKIEAERQRQLKDIEFGGGGMERFFGSKPSNLSPGLRERYIISRNNYFDKIKSGGNTDDIVQASYVWDEAPSQSESESLDKFKFTSDRIAELKTELEGEATGPIIGIIRSANPFDEKARLIKAQITKIIPGLARGVFGEVGVLTDQDVAMYSRTIGNLTTPEEVNETLTKAAMDMVARGFEDKLVTMAKNRKNVSGYLDTLKDIKAKRSAVVGEEEAPAASVEVDELQLTDDGKPVISEELVEQMRSTGADIVEVTDKSTGTKRKIKINRVKAPAPQAPAVPTPNPPAEPVDKAFDALFGPGSIDATQSEATTDARDRKQQIQDRLKLLRERLSELPSPPSIQPSYAPVSPRISKADKDTAAQRRMILKAIKKSEAELKKL